METTNPAMTAPEASFQTQSSDLSVGDWMLTLFLTAIPLVGIIMLFVWGFGSGTPAAKANFAKAALIWMAIVIAFYAVIIAIFGAAMFNMM